MKRALQVVAALVAIIVLVIAWLYDKNSQPTPQVQQQSIQQPVAPQPPIRGADDMRSLKIP